VKTTANAYDDEDDDNDEEVERQTTEYGEIEDGEMKNGGAGDFETVEDEGLLL